jgi:epoxyqueuosine reductase
MKKILLHVCCGPCAIYPVRELRGAGMDVTGFFYRNNIHPYTECLKRQQTLEDYAAGIDLRLICPTDYDLEGFLQKITFRESNRCIICYRERLTSAAHIARRGRFDGFSTTLLYSKFQKHDLIREIGEAAGAAMDVPFYYQDFRTGWKEGITESRRLGMYRQLYCGCIYSEKDRFYHPKE